MTKLTALVQDHIIRLFPLDEREEVRRLLQEDCVTTLNAPSNAMPEFFERIQCAVLKCSEGQMENLHGAIALAQADWRDLLVSADFAKRPNAYKDWKR